MNSYTEDGFWKLFKNLNPELKKRAEKVFSLWMNNPFHTSLQFKCINSNEDIWSVRISRKYRALGILKDNSVTWFWIGKHDDYEKYYG